MPLYTYRCQNCGASTTEFRKIAARDDLPIIDGSCESRDGAYTVLHMGGHQPERIIEAPYVAPDISAYQAIAVDVATGKAPVINSRSQHREFLKRNGYVEVGNEKVGGRNREAGEVRGDFNVRGDLAKATREVLGKQK